MKQIVTRESLAKMLIEASDEKRVRIIGRALVALYQRQTEDEKRRDDSTRVNHRGFCSSDAKNGSFAARKFAAHQDLEWYTVRRWMRTSTKSSLPYICKYARQLNEIANEKAMLA